MSVAERTAARRETTMPRAYARYRGYGYKRLTLLQVESDVHVAIL